MARILSVFLALFIASAAVAAPIEQRQLGNLACNIDRFKIVTALASTGGAVKKIDTTDPATATAVAAAQAGLTSAGDGIKTIALSLITGKAAPADARDQVKQGLLDAQTALTGITDAAVADAVTAAQTKLAGAIADGDAVVADCKNAELGRHILCWNLNALRPSKTETIWSDEVTVTEEETLLFLNCHDAIGMPLLAPSIGPPIPTSSKGSTFGTIPTKSNTKTASVSGSIPPNSTAVAEEKLVRAPSTVSTISLDVENISAELASELASALVGHVLFLKNQVPFPVMQLYRIPNGKSNPRALKLRTDLLASFDTLSSHLTTTFSALSTAFALTTNLDPKTKRPTRRAYLAILVGPSIGSAKTRVMFAVDGLVAKVWGERDDVPEFHDSDSSDEDESAEDDGDDEEHGPSDTDSSTDSDDEDASSPPPSRSPSPSPCTSPSPIPRIASPVPEGPSHAQTQQTLRTANRLLSHTLATADHSMAAELGNIPFYFNRSSANTHILVRAPRRFTHPAWIPRQTVSATLDGVLREFREEAGESEGTGDTEKKNSRKARSKSHKVEGAWVTCHSPGVEFPEDAAEEDEMIWWNWDGKIVGFTDW
ncbi:hypothetical protein C8R43DRAFT_1104199 [Mycena crocata]|nr:hypothetical protein C8R43DRAFT_1104199 [Mycena crocata]